MLRKDGCWHKANTTHHSFPQAYAYGSAKWIANKIFNLKLAFSIEYQHIVFKQSAVICFDIKISSRLLITDIVSINSYVSYMATEERLKKAVEQGIVSHKTADAIKVYNYRLNQNNMPIIYNLRHLRKILNIKKREQDLYFGKKRNEYHTFYIPKKNGDKRKIEAPSARLKAFQLWIKENILDKIGLSDYAMGFKKSRSIFDNAQMHTNKELVINVDLKDFFPTITYDKVYKIFAYMGYTNEVAHLLTQLCTNNDNVLPQGSPASPAISNIVAMKLDKRLAGIAEKYNCSYTRYADDITFSGGAGIKNIMPIVRCIIEEEGFTANEKKIRFQYSNQRQEVTGLIVNKKVSVSSAIIKEIDNAVYYCKKYGVESHMKRIGCDKSFYKEHLYGIAYFIKMIDVHKGEYYLSKLDQIVWSY